MAIRALTLVSDDAAIESRWRAIVAGFTPFLNTTTYWSSMVWACGLALRGASCEMGVARMAGSNVNRTARRMLGTADSTRKEGAEGSEVRSTRAELDLYGALDDGWIQEQERRRGWMGAV